MGLRFRQSFRVFPGVRLNVGKSGASVSLGVPGATVNVGPRGARATVGLPGTGLSYSADLTPRSSPSASEHGGRPEPQLFDDRPPSPRALPRNNEPRHFDAGPAMQRIGSASLESLSSTGLGALRDLIMEARAQKKLVEEDLVEARVENANITQELTRRRGSMFRWFYRRRIETLEQAGTVAEAEVARLADWKGNTFIRIDFETEEAARLSWGELVRTFEELARCKSIWDVTADRASHRVAERTAATRAVDRKATRISFGSTEVVRFSGRAMRFDNTNGEDIFIYPGMAVMPRSDGQFALIDLKDVEVEFVPVRFLEEEKVPDDAHILDTTWAKVNRDGTPDRRFRDNYRIPVVLYGRLVMSSRGGLMEEFQFSNAVSASKFADAFAAYKAALSG